jgi:beta-1,4-mannosyltransferase
MTTTLRVLFDTRESNWKDNPYIDLLARGVASDDLEVVGFSWRTLLIGRYDAMHVHWPEHLILQPTTLRTIAARILFSAALLRLRLRRTPIVRTMHNRTAHIAVPGADAKLLALFDRLVTARIWLSEREDEDARRGSDDVVIPHSDYTPWLATVGVSADTAPGADQLLCFGVVRRYKRFEEVAHAAIALGYPHLTIAGVTSEADYAAELAQLAEQHPSNITLVPRRLDSSELVTSIQSANLIVVPYADLYNSGVILLTLSLQRPVALRDGPAARLLAEEYGDHWIRRYTGELTADALNNVLHTKTVASGPAYSARREWRAATDAHRALYRRVAAK